MLSPRSVGEFMQSMLRAVEAWLRALSSPTTLRTRLVTVAVATLVPVVLFSVVVTAFLAQRERAAREHGLQATAAALAVAVDREFHASIMALTALAATPHLDTSSLSAFYEQARRVVEQLPWYDLWLVDVTGQQLLSTLWPLGTPLPSLADRPYVQAAVDTRSGQVSDLLIGRLIMGFHITVAVPVVRDEAVKYVLVAGYKPEALAEVLAREVPADEAEWTRTIVDRAGRIAARTRDPDTFVGDHGTARFIDLTRRAASGIYIDTTIDGQPVYVAFHRAAFSGWTAAAAVPVSVIEGPMWRSLALVGGTGLILIAASVVLAIASARRIARPLQSAGRAAQALAQGQPVTVDRSNITEVVDLAIALEQAALLLRERQQERDRLYHEAETANRAKDRFLAILSHELRTPLTAMLGWLRLLRSGRLDPAKTAHGLEVVERNTRAQARLIEDLLDVSRIVTGRLQLDRRPVDLVQLADEVLERVRAAAEEKGLRLEKVAGAAVGPVFGDPTRLQQVITNLLSNAIKFTPSGGRIRLTVTRDAEHVRLTVVDTGTGIDRDVLGGVWDPFQQASGARPSSRTGLGLGLAIVRHLVELHGGRVEARSGGLGAGAEFGFRLPLAVAAPAVEREVQAAGPGTGLRGLRVLIVEDDIDTQELLTLILTVHGAAVQTAGSVGDAMDQLRHWRPDVVVSDIALPDGDGYELIQRIRQTIGVPVLALTAYASAEDAAQAVAAGFSMHLSKPIDPDALVARLAAVVGR